MNNNNKFLLHVFEKIGVPLFASVNDFSSRAIISGQAAKPLSNTEQAEVIAKLLTNVTQASAIISSKLGLEEKDPESDDLHISMAAILSPVISNMYQLTGSTLNDEDIGKISTSFETLATFSNHFSSIKEGNDRIKNLDASNSASDISQAKLQNILGMVPIINSVAAFSFGEDQNKLIKKIIQRVEKEVTRIEKSLPDDVNNNPNSSLQIVNTIAMMYSQCHFSEMARIMALSDKDRESSPVTIDNVWKIFDQKISMLEIMVESIIPNKDKTDQVDSGNVIAQIKEPVVGDSIQKTDDTSGNIQVSASEAPATPSGGPMSFFAGKPSDTDKVDE